MVYAELLEKHELERLSVKQEFALQKIVEFMRNKNGLFPSLREIVRFLGLSSVSEADRYVKILVDKGYLSRIEDEEGRRMARGMEISANFVALLEEVQYEHVG